MTPQQEIKRKKDRIKLQREWYAELKKTGFNDIEVLGADGEMLHDLQDSGRFNQYSDHVLYPEWPRTLQSVSEEYYEQARVLLTRDLTEKVFRIPPDRTVWELHCEGMTEEDIALRTEYTRNGIHSKIAKYQKLLGSI